MTVRAHGARGDLNARQHAYLLAILEVDQTVKARCASSRTA